MNGSLDLWLWIVGAIWLLMTVSWIRDLRSIPFLPVWTREEAAGAGGTLVSVIVAARDEGERIETTVDRMLAQRGVDLELIVVDDRSTDGTTETLRRLASARERLRVIRVDRLPEGWLGKCHALHVGASRASGSWLLFADADAWLATDAVSRAVAFGERSRADLICLLPMQRRPTLGGMAANLAFSVALIGGAGAVNRDARLGYIGIGAFNLIRTGMHRRIGGHEPLRLEVCDDVKLGLLVKRAGGRTRALFAGQDVEVDWARSAAGMVRAIEKNSFAILRFSVPLAILAITASLSLWCSALLGPLRMTPAGWAAFAGMALMIIPARMMSRRAGWGWAPAVLAPLAWSLLPLAIARSAWRTLRSGGVTWRGTFYPLSVLRRGVVR